jgi:hypothetical protein
MIAEYREKKPKGHLPGLSLFKGTLVEKVAVMEILQAYKKEEEKEEMNSTTHLNMEIMNPQ